jgi:hypothetical protein
LSRRASNSIKPATSTKPASARLISKSNKANQLGRDQHIQVQRGGVTVTFSRDARGKAAICVTGPGHSDEELRTIGGELSQRVVQKYVHRRLMDEIHARQFVIVEEEVDENNAIRLKVRHWDG